MTRILIADDHSLIRTGISTLLQGYAEFIVVGEAANGAEAVALTEQLDPDVVLMDIQMPEMNGLEATAQIAQGRGHPHREQDFRVAVVHATPPPCPGSGPKGARAEASHLEPP